MNRYLQYPNPVIGREAPIPQPENIVFQQNFYDGVTTPSIGSATYTRSGSVCVPTTDGTALTEFGSNAMPIGVRRYQGSETLSGAYFAGAINNYLKYSEDFSQAEWVKSTGVTVDADEEAWILDGVSADLITGDSAGDSVTQTSARTVGNLRYVWSVWLKTVSGTAEVTLKVADEGTQSGITTAAVTTTWNRFQIAHTFVSGTGAAVASIIVDDQAVLACGAQLEEFVVSGTSQRQRYGTANWYVRTGAATASAGNSSYIMPNAIVTEITTKGSWAAWVCTDVDVVTDYIRINESQYFWSVAAEKFALSSRSSEGPLLWINDAGAVPPTSGTLNFTNSLPSDQWTHLAVTWDTDAEEYKTYQDGVLTVSSTTARTPPVVGANNMNIGGYGTPTAAYGADAVFSEFIFWDNPLTADEVASLYSRKQAIAKRAAPGTGTLMEVDFRTSPVPTTGDTRFEYNRRGNGTPYYYDSETSTVVSAMDAYPLQAYPLNPPTAVAAGGMAFFPRTTNHILQSEAIETTWVPVGAPTLTEAGGTFLGSINYGTIDGDATEGIEQTTAFNAASSELNFSVYASVASGTLDFTLELEGASGGTPETKTSDTFTATTTPQRFTFGATAFTGAATGLAKAAILLSATGVLRVGGFMLEKRRVTGEEIHIYAPNNYIKTTTATVSTLTSNIIYRALDSINYTKGSFMAWGFLYASNPSEWISPEGPSFFGAPGGQATNAYFHILRGQMDNIYSGRQYRMATDSFSVNRNEWHMYGYTWDASSGTDVTLKMYFDGQPVAASTTGTFVSTLKKRRFIFAGDENHVSLDSWCGSVGQFRIAGHAYSDAEMEDWYTETLSNWIPE